MPEPSTAEQNTGGEATVSDFPASSSSKRLLLVAVDGTLSWSEQGVAVGQEEVVEELVEEALVQLISTIVTVEVLRFFDTWVLRICYER